MILVHVLEVDLMIVLAVVRGRRAVLRDGQRGSGSHQVVAGVVREAAGFAQRAGGAHANEGPRGEQKMKAKRDSWPQTRLPTGNPCPDPCPAQAADTYLHW